MYSSGRKDISVETVQTEIATFHYCSIVKRAFPFPFPLSPFPSHTPFHPSAECPCTSKQETNQQYRHPCSRIMPRGIHTPRSKQKSAFCINPSTTAKLILFLKQSPRKNKKQKSLPRMHSLEKTHQVPPFTSQPRFVTSAETVPSPHYLPPVVCCCSATRPP